MKTPKTKNKSNCATEHELSSKANENWLDSSIQSFNKGRIIKTDLENDK